MWNKPLLLLLFRGDSPAGEKRWTDSNSGAAKPIFKRGEKCGHQSQNTGGHPWTQSPAGGPAAREEVEEHCGSNLVLWTTKVLFTFKWLPVINRIWGLTQHEALEHSSFLILWCRAEFVNLKLNVWGGLLSVVLLTVRYCWINSNSLQIVKVAVREISQALLANNFNWFPTHTIFLFLKYINLTTLIGAHLAPPGNSVQTMWLTWELVFVL